MTDDRDIRPTAIAARTKQLIERSRELADRAKQTIAESRRLMEELRSVHPGAFSGGVPARRTEAQLTLGQARAILSNDGPQQAVVFM